MSQVEIGTTYTYFLTAHCGFRSLGEQIDGAYWYVAEDDLDPDPFARAMAAWNERQRFGVTGELHYVDEDTMVLSVPDTGESLTYTSTQDKWFCY